jgi:hypothetical protein
MASAPLGLGGAKTFVAVVAQRAMAKVTRAGMSMA